MNHSARMRKIIIRALSLTLGLAGLIFGDQVTLKNGDKISGTVTKSDAGALWIKTDYAGEIKIDRAQIVELSTAEPVNVQLKDKTVVGTVAPAQPGTVAVQTPQAGTINTPLTEVVAVRNDAEQKAYEREQERLLRPRLTDFWVGYITASLAGASGNAKTTSYTTAASAARAAGKNKMTLYFNQVYATQSTTQPSGATANRLSGGYRIDRDVSSRLFVFGTSDFDYDQFLDLDLRSVLGGGLGYHIWKADKGFWDFNVGGTWNREKFGTGLIRKSGEILIGDESAYTAFNRVKLYHKLVFFPNLSDTGQYRLSFDGTAGLPIYKWLEWNIGLSDRFLSNPLTGRQKNDLLYTTGIRVSFDQTKRR